MNTKCLKACAFIVVYILSVHHFECEAQFSSLLGLGVKKAPIPEQESINGIAVISTSSTTSRPRLRNGQSYVFERLAACVNSATGERVSAQYSIRLESVTGNYSVAFSDTNIFVTPSGRPFTITVTPTLNPQQPRRQIVTYSAICGTETLRQTYTVSWDLPPEITSSRELFSFYTDEDIPNYPKAISLAAYPPPPSASGTNYTWTIELNPAYQNQIRFSNTFDSIFSSSTGSVEIEATKASTSFLATNVFLTVNSVTSDPFPVRVRRPRQLLPLLTEHRTPEQARSSGRIFQSREYYQIVDQFGNVLPYNIPINESFVSASPTYDVGGGQYFGWEALPNRGQPGVTVDPASWFDSLAVPVLFDLSGINPDPVARQTPLSSVGVLRYFNGQWRVGSSIEGRGNYVQRNTYRLWIDHGQHEDVSSPPASPPPAQ